MKKILFAVFVSAIFVSWLSTDAQEIKRTSFGIGVEYRTKTMDLEPTQFSPPLESLDKNYQAFKIEQEYNMPMALLHLGFLNNIDLAFIFGLMDYDLTQKSDIEGFGHDFTADTTNAFGFSGQIILPATEKIYVGFFFEHFTSEIDDVEFADGPPSLNFTIENVPFPINIDDVQVERLKYHETTLTPVVALKWGKFMPYAGPRYTSITANTNVTYIIGDRDLKRNIKYGPVENWSFVIGLKAWITDNLSLNAEVETMENESYKVGVTYTF